MPHLKALFTAVKEQFERMQNVLHVKFIYACQNNSNRQGDATSGLRLFAMPSYFTTKETGSGLGLATISSIIKRHGGQIDVVSQLGEGTTFTLLLPAALTEEPSVSTVNDTKMVPLAGKFLLMDDEETIRTSLTLMLESLGCTVESTSNGQQAIDSFRNAQDQSTPFDLVMLDLTIPGGKGGKETAQAILQLDPAAKLVISSGYSADDVMANYRDYGFRGVVKKPYLFESLTLELSRILKEV